MRWVVQLYDKMYPWCVESPNFSYFHHIGEIYERVMALAIGQENLNDIKLNILHDHALKKLSY